MATQGDGMGWFSRRKAPKVEAPQVALLPGLTFTDSAGRVTELHRDPDAEPMTDERYDQIVYEIDEFKARREAFQREGQFRGKHFLEWIPELDRLRTEKSDDEALVILAELAPVTDRAYRAWGEKIGGLAEHRIAVIYRRRKMFVEEVALLEDYLQRHPDHEAPDLRARLVKARAILAASALKATLEEPTTRGKP